MELKHTANFSVTKGFSHVESGVVMWSGAEEKLLPLTVCIEKRKCTLTVRK